MSASTISPKATAGRLRRELARHWHPTAEHVRVISGEFMVGMGDALDATKTKKLAAGDTGTIGAKRPTTRARSTRNEAPEKHGAPVFALGL